MDTFLSEYGVGKVIVAGREYLSIELVVYPKKAGVRGKTYLQYIATIPKPVALELYRRAGEDSNTRLHVIALLSPAEWYHGLLWSKMKNTLSKLPENIRKEMTALGIEPSSEEETVLVIAKKKQLEQLDLDPSKPITLKELKEKIIEKTLKTVTPVSQSPIK